MSKAPQVFKNFIPATVRVVGADSLAGQRLLSNNLGRIRQFYTTQRGIADTGVISLNRGMIDAPEITMTYRKIQGQEYVDVILRPVNPLTVPHPHKFIYKPTLTYISSTFILGRAPTVGDIVDEFGNLRIYGQSGGVDANLIYFMVDLYRLGLRPRYYAIDMNNLGLNPANWVVDNNFIGSDLDNFAYYDEYGNSMTVPASLKSRISVTKPATVPFTLGGGQLIPWWKGRPVFGGPYNSFYGPTGLSPVDPPPPQRRPVGHIGPWNPGPNTNLVSWARQPLILGLGFGDTFGSDGFNVSQGVDVTPPRLTVTHAGGTTSFLPIGADRYTDRGYYYYWGADVLFKRVKTPA